MPPDPESISDAIARTRARRVFIAAAIVCLTVGTVAALVYARRGLTLSHYDARAHLGVARRIFDSLTPGWQQVGAIWLPLPHLLNALPIQIDWVYRTGAVAVALSIGALGLGLASWARWIFGVTRSTTAAIAAPLLILLNPGVLYLQSTPMTEPLLFGLSLLAVVRMAAWLRDPSPREARWLGWTLFALTWTRYEGWFIVCALLAFAAPRRWWRPWWTIARYPAVAVGAFLCLGRGSNDAWFVFSGFFQPQPETLHQPLAALAQVMDDGWLMTGPVIVIAALAGAVVCLVRAFRDRADAVPLALIAALGLPLFAYFQGHPTQVRFAVVMAVACGALAALSVMALPRAVRGLAMVGLVAAMALARPPMDTNAPLMKEARWELPFEAGRQAVTAYLAIEYDGGPILTSMYAFPDYMHESAAAGVHLRNFVHEGNELFWKAALASPKSFVRWVIVSIDPARPDTLARRLAKDPGFLAGFSRVAEGGGIALYGRDPVVVLATAPGVN